MKKLLLIALLLAASSANAQTILKFNGLSLSNEGLSGPIHGTFIEPLNQFSYNPLVVDNGQIRIGANVNISVAVGLVWGTVTPDATVKTNIDTDPDFILDAFAGNGFLQQSGLNGVYIDRGTFGFGFAIPHLLGDLAPNIAFPIDGGPIMLGVGIIGGLDFLNGFGVIQVH